MEKFFPKGFDFWGEASWYSFTESEQAILRKTIRHFSRALRAGFLPDPKDGEEGDRGV